MKTLWRWAGFTLILGLGACGGGGGGGGGGASSTITPSLLTAVFFDAPVTGLTYTASPSGTTGTTNGLGMFNYQSGDTVAFTAGGQALGSVTNLPGTSTAGAPALVTPLHLASGNFATPAISTDPKATAIGQYLAGLNSVALGVGQGNSGLYTVPTASNATVQTLYNTIGTAGVTAGTFVTAMQPGGSINGAIVTAGGVVPNKTNAQANLVGATDATGVAGTLWTAPCTLCTGGAGTMRFYFNADGVVWGVGSLGDPNARDQNLVGTWYTIGLGQVFFDVVGDGATTAGFDAYYASGTVTASTGSGSLTAYQYGLLAPGVTSTLTLEPIPAGTSTAFNGVWALKVTNVPGIIPPYQGDVLGSSAIAVVDTNNSFTTASLPLGSSTYSPVTGVGSSTQIRSDVATANCGVATTMSDKFTFDLTSGTFQTTDPTGAVVSSGTATRAGFSSEVLGNFYDNGQTLAEQAAEVEIPLSLNVRVNWPSNPSGKATAAIALGVVMTGTRNLGTVCSRPATPKLEGVAVKPEISTLGVGAGLGATFDVFTAQYIKGQVLNYSVSLLGPYQTYCSVTGGGSGVVNDANSGNPAAYHTVVVTCTQ